ncbi:MAG: EAL domain-containing protein [Lactimicrobium sp.]|jgi:EAL domain-containing protein (putative c-di-GMP-specific phosphodiesterase class I)|uniref:EAL domain-containing protein n=1 Tax=Lactimicrobium sp. TaxID=2563780 RepID=UPI002F357465
MKLDTSYSIPTLMILIVFLVQYLLRPRLKIDRTRIYLKLLAVDMAASIIDIWSTQLDNNPFGYSNIVLQIANVLFFALFIARTQIFLNYLIALCGRLHTGSKLYLAFTRIFFVACELIVLSTPWTHAVFAIDSYGYHPGNLYNLIYLHLYVTAAAGFLLVAKNRNHLEKQVWIRAYVCLTLLSVGAVVRAFSHMLIMNMFFLLDIFILYDGIENPDHYLASRAGTFNIVAFRQLYDELLFKKKPFVMSGFCLKNYSYLRSSYGSQLSDEGLHQVGLWLHQAKPDVPAFYLHHGRFLLLGSSEELQDLPGLVRARFAENWHVNNSDLILDTDLIEISPDVHFKNSEQFMDVLDLALVKHSDGPIILNEELIQMSERHNAVQRLVADVLQNHGIQVYLQPIINAADGRTIGAEALSRLHDDTLGTVSPLEFIPVAEQMGRIDDFTLQVADKVGVFIEEGGLERCHIDWININLCPLNCMNRSFPARLHEVLQQHHVSPSQVHLEITEEAMVDRKVLKQMMDGMIAMGYSFSLDDYGTGYANASRQMELPFVNVKLDLSVVREYMKTGNKLVPAMVMVLQHDQLSITAEGVETLEMAQKMKQIGCTYLQGYFYSRPLPMAEFEEWCEKRMPD